MKTVRVSRKANDPGSLPVGYALRSTFELCTDRREVTLKRRAEAYDKKLWSIVGWRWNLEY